MLLYPTLPILHSILLLLSTTTSTKTTITVVDAWSPNNLWRLGRGQRLRPVPTNLCVLAERPPTAAASSSSPSSSSSSRREEEEEEREYNSIYHAVPIYTDFNDVDLVSTAPGYFDYEKDIVSPYDEHERDYSFQMPTLEVPEKEENNNGYSQTQQRQQQDDDDVVTLLKLQRRTHRITILNNHSTSNKNMTILTTTTTTKT